LAIRYQLRIHGPKLTIEEAQIIDDKRTRLQSLIDTFEHHADSVFLNQRHANDSTLLNLGSYDEYDHADDPDTPSSKPGKRLGHASHHTLSMASDGSGMNVLEPEDLPILLPSSLGWEWCVNHGVKPIAVKEARLRHAQANDSIHRIRLALGFKSAIFRTQVRPAKTQKTKTRAWNAVHSVDTTVNEHARIYSMARDSYRTIREAYPSGPDLPELQPNDLHIATMVLGSNQAGQRNTQKSWIWGFGQTVEDDGTWMDDCRVSF
jgi:hypothetical protein